MILYLAFAVLFLIPFPLFIDGNSKLADGYLTKDATLPIKGFSVTLVFLSHFYNYAKPLGATADVLYRFMISLTGQSIVTMFLFYSGFGIYESIRTKGSPYVSGFLKKRFLPTWINFAVCVGFYMVYKLIKGEKLYAAKVLPALIGWISIGNSNWFMFVTFVLYILVFVSFIGFINSPKLKSAVPIAIFIALTAVFACILYFTRSSWWYNTIFCFPLGMLYSYYKKEIDAMLHKHYGACLMILLALTVLFRIASLWQNVIFCAYSAVFSLLVVVITVKIRFRNPLFNWMGKHVFSIYILQRLVFMVLRNRFDNAYVYFIASFAVTLLISALYDFIRGKIHMVNKLRPEA